MEPLADALNTEVRVRVPASAIIAFAIVVVLLLFTAAVSASWLFAVPTIALAMAAGWLIATSRSV